MHTGIAAVAFVGFMICTARILLIYLCCPRNRPVNGSDAPMEAAAEADNGAPRGQGGHISLTILHPNNEACTPVRDAMARTNLETISSRLCCFAGCSGHPGDAMYATGDSVCCICISLVNATGIRGLMLGRCASDAGGHWHTACRSRGPTGSGGTPECRGGQPQWQQLQWQLL